MATIKKTIDISKDLTKKQQNMLKKAEKKPYQLDPDNPPITKEELSMFERVSDMTDDEENMTISKRLFHIMDNKRISIPELSRLTGISKPTIYDWKKKNTNPGADKIMILCEALKISPVRLLTGKDDDNKEVTVSGENIQEFKTDKITIEVIKEINKMSVAQKKRLLDFFSMIADM